MKHAMTFIATNGFAALSCSCGWKQEISYWSVEEVAALAKKHAEVKHEIRAQGQDGSARVNLYCTCGWRSPNRPPAPRFSALAEEAAAHMLETERGDN